MFRAAGQIPSPGLRSSVSEDAYPCPTGHQISGQNKVNGIHEGVWLPVVGSQCPWEGVREESRELRQMHLSLANG